jgi:hypothetical protein
MKRFVAMVSVLLAFFSGGVAFALGPLGTLPPEPEDVGTYSVTGGYLLQEVRLVPRKSGYARIAVRQSHYYAQLSRESFGWEWDARLGMADFSDGKAFDVGYKPFAGLGLKAHLYGDRFSEYGLAASFRADLYSRYKVSGETVAPGLEANVRVKDYWAAEGGLIAHRRFDRLTVYGGPLIQYAEGKVYRTTTVPVGTASTGDSYYKIQSAAGLAGGISWQRGDARFGFEAGASSGRYSAGVEAALGF